MLLLKSEIVLWNLLAISESSSGVSAPLSQAQSGNSAADDMKYGNGRSWLFRRACAAVCADRSISLATALYFSLR